MQDAAFLNEWTVQTHAVSEAKVLLAGRPGAALSAGTLQDQAPYKLDSKVRTFDHDS